MAIYISPRKSWRIFLLVAGLVLLVSWGIAVEHVTGIKSTSEAAAARRVVATASVHARQVALTIDVADEALHHLESVLVSEGISGVEREAQRISLAGVGGPINRVQLLDASGQMLVNQRDGRDGELASVRERDFFKALEKRTTSRYYVSEPLRSRFTDEWIVLFSRPLLDNGFFNGALVVGLPAARLGGFFAISDDNELITLLSAEHRVIARSQNGAAIGKKIANLPVSRNGVPFTNVSSIDGQRRLVALREVGDSGMYVAAGTDLTALDDEVATHTHIALLPAILLTMLLLPASLIIRRASLEQLAAHEALRAETQRSRTVFETMDEGILLLDAYGRIEFINARAETWLAEARGVRFAEAMRQAGFAFSTEDGAALPGEDPVSARCLGAGRDVDGVWLRRRCGSSDIWLALRGRAFHDADRVVSGAVLTLADRSEEHERLTELALNAGIIDGMQDAVMITDAHGRILRANPAFFKLTGFAAEEIVGHTPARLKSERHDAEFFTAMWRELLNVGSWSGRIWNRRASGEEYCAWHNITSVRDAHGRIARYITISRDITEQETRESELWRRANFDSLTGLANRVRFEDRMANALASAERDKHGFTVFYLDLDYFKPVNDTLGHAAGDELLRQVALRMRSTLREEDTLARIGGDEFALILPRMQSGEHAARVAGKILELVQMPFELVEGTAKIGISIGIAHYPQDGSDAKTLQEAADAALYAAKNGGRNRWCFAGATGNGEGGNGGNGGEGAGA